MRARKGNGENPCPRQVPVPRHCESIFFKRKFADMVVGDGTCTRREPSALLSQRNGGAGFPPATIGFSVNTACLCIVRDATERRIPGRGSQTHGKHPKYAYERKRTQSCQSCYSNYNVYIFGSIEQKSLNNWHFANHLDKSVNFLFIFQRDCAIIKGYASERAPPYLRNGSGKGFRKVLKVGHDVRDVVEFVLAGHRVTSE